MGFREGWFERTRKLEWRFDYVSEAQAFPPDMSGTPWLPSEAWAAWDEPYRTTYRDYVHGQSQKEEAVAAVRDAIGQAGDFAKHDRAWLSAVKLHAATLPLAEFAATVGNLRAARFARDSAWRTTATLGALDELRHAQIPLELMHALLPWDGQFDWTHRFFHTNNWVAIAGRHLVDELLVTANPIELAVGTNFVFETGFTNLQFIGLSAVAHGVGDRMFETLLQSIQTDEARHAQIGISVLEILVQHDREYAQYLVDKWFWRSWLFFAVVTGLAMDYLTPLAGRKQSFKEFVEEWVTIQFDAVLARVGLKRPWYWEQFEQSRDYFHHMVYASAYTHRATVWFDMPLPGPDERAWLAEKYPASWPSIDPIFERISERCAQAGPGVEWFTHGVTPVAFCSLCQLVLCGGTPHHNTARVRVDGGVKRAFCSEPCEWIFQRETERYSGHKDVVQRILAGEAPGNLLELVHRYFGLNQSEWGKDVAAGEYPWLSSLPRANHGV